MNHVAHEIIKPCFVSFALLLPVNLLRSEGYFRYGVQWHMGKVRDARLLFELFLS